MNSTKIIGALLGVLLVCVLVALLNGAIMYWSNASIMIHTLYEHFGIADLTYSQYVSGSFLLSLIFNCFHAKASYKKED